MAIEMVPVRARIKIGDLVVSTPYVQSFNVRKQRGQASSFDATLKVRASSASRMSGSGVEISAGSSSVRLIFTGICKAAKVSPCYDDPNYVILSVSGVDALYKLEGQLYTRRCRGTESTWVTITGVTRKGLKSGKFSYSNEPTLHIDDGDVFKNTSFTIYGGQSSYEKNTVQGVGTEGAVPPVVLTVTPISKQ